MVLSYRFSLPSLKKKEEEKKNEVAKSVLNHFFLDSFEINPVLVLDTFYVKYNSVLENLPRFSTKFLK